LTSIHPLSATLESFKSLNLTPEQFKKPLI